LSGDPSIGVPRLDAISSHSRAESRAMVSNAPVFIPPSIPLARSHPPGSPSARGQLDTVLTDKILRGAQPGDIPVERPTKYHLVINLKTAKALGLTLNPSLVLRPANEDAEPASIIPIGLA